MSEKKEQKKLYKDYKQSVFSQSNLTPQYKPSGKAVATQFGIKRPLNEQVNMKNPHYKNFQTTGIIPQRHVGKDMSVQQHIQRNDEMTQNFVERLAGFHGGSAGGAMSEWKKKPKGNLNTRGIPNVKQNKTMGSHLKRTNPLKLFSPVGLMSYIMKPRPAGANSTLDKTSGEYVKIKGKK
tara:strand:- start:71 stop:610 length:540 start_codon:yes stop_codon:yes gene_type:complete